MWLKNPENITKDQQETMAKLKDCDLDTAKAYRMRLILQEIYRYPAAIASMVLKDWIQWGLRCRLEPMVDVAKMLQNHYEDLAKNVNWELPQPRRLLLRRLIGDAFDGTEPLIGSFHAIAERCGSVALRSYFVYVQDQIMIPERKIASGLDAFVMDMTYDRRSPANLGQQ